MSTIRNDTILTATSGAKERIGAALNAPGDTLLNVLDAVTTEIVALAGQLGTARAAVERYHNSLCEAREEREQALEEADTARAEVERLRGALKHYANKNSWGDAGKLYGDPHARRPKSDLWMGEGDDGWTAARAALGGKGS